MSRRGGWRRLGRKRSRYVDSKGERSTTPTSSSAFAVWSSRLRGPTSGSHQLPGPSCRPREPTRRAGASTSTTRAFGRHRSVPSSIGSCTSPSRCRHFGRGPSSKEGRERGTRTRNEGARRSRQRIASLSLRARERDRQLDRPYAELLHRRTSRVLAAVMRKVGQELGNTPAVARASYVSPAVIEQYRAGRTIDDFRRKTARPARLSADERALLRLLRVDAR